MFEFVLNGRVVRVPETAANMTLLDFLRAQGLTGAKEGCAEGECGACAVAVRSPTTAGSEYRAVNSCLMLLPMAAGREITTVEALARDGRLAPVQEALAAAGGSQCGYCTPGFVMSLFAEYYRPGRVGPCDPRALEGNLCRCTGYRPIADAAHSLGPAPADAFSERLREPAPPVRELALDGFSRPTTVDACVALLGDHPDATVVAGGTDLVVERNLRHRTWPHLVSVEAIDELRAFEDTTEYVRIGAALPLADLPPRWPDAPDALREWVSLFASPLIRNRATLGGNLATASPVGDGAPLLLALDAWVEVAGAGTADGGTVARRVIPLSGFFTGYRKTALGRGELIVAVRIPKPLPHLLRFYKVSKRRLDDISTVAAAFAIDAPAGLVSRARITFGGVAATPLRVREAEAALEGHPWDLRAVTRVQEILERVLTPMSDHRGSREYRLAVSSRLVEKCWWESQP
jgi:xanthine dehydrogenase small subunit